MEAITIDELIEKLKKFENKYIVVVLEGNIQEKISMDLAESDEDTEFYIYLDGKQRVIIFTDMEVLLNYNLLNWRNRGKYI